MNALKRIMGGLIVLIISSTIFYLLLQDQEVKDDIMSSTLKLFGDELLAMVPEGEERDALEKRISEFITKVENRELTEDQVKMTFARGMNLQLAQEKPTLQEIEALWETPEDTSRPQPPAVPEPKRWPSEDWNDEYLAHRMRDVMAFKDDLIRLSREEKEGRDISRYTMVTPDSDLQIIIDANIRDNHTFKEHPEIRRFIRKLPDKDLIKFENFDESPNAAKQAIEVYAPFLPPNVRHRIKVSASADGNMSLVLDSLNIDIPAHFFNLDSMHVMINKVTKELEKSEEK